MCAASPESTASASSPSRPPPGPTPSPTRPCPWSSPSSPSIRPFASIAAIPPGDALRPPPRSTRQPTPSPPRRRRFSHPWTPSSDQPRTGGLGSSTPRTSPSTCPTRRGSSPDREKHPESGDAHDVVDDRCPHVGAKDLPGVEKLAQQVVQPVEEELRQAQEGEEDRQMTDVVGVSRRCDHDQNGCEHHRHEGHEEQDRSGQRQQAIDVGVAIAATLDGPHNLGDQDRVEDPRGEKIEDGVGQGVGGLEGGAMERLAVLSLWQRQRPTIVLRQR